MLLNWMHKVNINNTYAWYICQAIASESCIQNYNSRLCFGIRQQKEKKKCYLIIIN